MDFPKELPMDAQSFRVAINDKHGSSRYLISEWMPRLSWTLRFKEEVLPELRKAGQIHLISCSAGPQTADHGGPPNVYWHWKGGAWKRA